MDKGGGRSNNHQQGSHRGTNSRRRKDEEHPQAAGPFVLVAAVVAVLATASGLSVKGASAAKRSNVTLTIDVFGDFGYHDLYKQYEASHPGITIKEVTEDYAEHHAALAQHLATGAGADDIEAIEVGFIANYTTQSRFFVDLRKYGASKLKKRYPNWKYQQAVAHNKKVIGLGTDVGASASATGRTCSRRRACRRSRRRSGSCGGRGRTSSPWASAIRSMRRRAPNSSTPGATSSTRWSRRPPPATTRRAAR